jgi:hypothetical protein
MADSLTITQLAGALGMSARNTAPTSREACSTHHGFRAAWPATAATTSPGSN